MKKLSGSPKTFLTVSLFSFAAFLLLPIITMACVPHFERNLTICSYGWSWLGGYHVIDQKLGNMMNSSLLEWRDSYLMYELWSFLVLLISAVVLGLVAYLLFNFWRGRKPKAEKDVTNPLVLPLVLLLVVWGFNVGVHRVMNARNHEETRIMAPGEGIFVPDVGVVPSEVNGNGPLECMNNKPELCVLSPSVDLYPSPGESMQNPEYKPNDNTTMKEIGGVLVGNSGNTITIKSTTGKLYNITFPVDVISWWSEVRSQHYDGYKISNGEIITVMYLEPLTEHSTEIGPSQIFSSGFAIDPQDKSDTSPIKRYSGPLE